MNNEPIVNILAFLTNFQDFVNKECCDKKKLFRKEKI